jgi:hypothetical protein
VRIAPWSSGSSSPRIRQLPPAMPQHYDVELVASCVPVTVRVEAVTQPVSRQRRGSTMLPYCWATMSLPPIPDGISGLCARGRLGALCSERMHSPYCWATIRQHCRACAVGRVLTRTSTRASHRFDLSASRQGERASPAHCLCGGPSPDSDLHEPRTGSIGLGEPLASDRLLLIVSWPLWPAQSITHKRN